MLKLPMFVVYVEVPTCYTKALKNEKKESSSNEPLENMC